MRVAMAGTRFPGWDKACLAFILPLITMTFLLVASSIPAAKAAPQRVVSPEPGEQEIEQMRSIAESQFEIVKILIKQGRYDRVLPEMKKIYDLNLTEKYEQATAESTSLAANLLVERRQFDLALQILDAAFGHMRRNDNRAALLKVMAFVYKSEGNLDKAVELLNRAVELERQGVHP